MSFFRIIDYQTFSVMFLSILSTFICHKYNLSANIPTGLIGIAIIFPIVFSINAAYKRREEALRYFASFKAHAIALYYAHRDWGPANTRLISIERIRDLFKLTMNNLQEFFEDEKNRDNKNIDKIYDVFSKLSKSHENLRSEGVPGNEISRANQYLRAMIIEFERMKNIFNYRTPLSLRAYSSIFLNSFPVLYGPYFAYLSDKYYPAIGYVVAIVYSLVLVSLNNIQEDLENPFDSIGEDDMKLDVYSSYAKIINDTETEISVDSSIKQPPN